jgi:hypothetical protein
MLFKLYKKNLHEKNYEKNKISKILVGIGGFESSIKAFEFEGFGAKVQFSNYSI